MQQDSDRFRAWTQHIYQHFAVELGDDTLSYQFEGKFSRMLNARPKEAGDGATHANPLDLVNYSGRLTNSTKVRRT
jgi:hypothetical protein